RHVDPLRIIQTLKTYDKTWDINQCVRGKTVLSEACTRFFRNRNRQQQLTLIQYLLANGADINANNRNSNPSYRWNSNWLQRVYNPEIRRLLNLPPPGMPNQNYRR
ncbi:MAG: hypothetical protein IKC65_03660, partial [Lentisphaeria bacterium]|nr:hypothetical protein [Lentisphaeria bacterium]